MRNDMERFEGPFEPVQVGECAHKDCGTEIYEDDEVIYVEDGMVCHSCFWDYAKGILNAVDGLAKKLEME